MQASPQRRAVPAGAGSVQRRAPRADRGPRLGSAKLGRLLWLPTGGLGRRNGSVCPAPGDQAGGSVRNQCKASSARPLL